MSDTPYLDLPFPVDTDKIAQGAQNIEDLAEQAEANELLANNSRAATDSYKNYPLGLSIMRIGGGQPGWPYGYGQAITFRHRDNANALQFWNAQSTVVARQQAMWRLAYSQTITGGQVADLWTEWRPIGSPIGAAQLVATGAVTVPGKTSDFASVTVTFPSGLFSTTPAVVASIRGSTPNIGQCVANVSNTKFDILVDRPSGADTYCYWIAASNSSSFG